MLGGILRPILLVLDPPDMETISTRKLILESAKYNVLTATTAEEAIEIAESAPIHAIVLHEQAGMPDIASLAQRLRSARPSIPLWILSPHPQPLSCADKVLSSYDPLALVELVQQTFGKYTQPSDDRTK
jgi:CheY-like chemotaxis protein